MILPKSIRLSDAVQGALDEGKPVVALESAVLTHGLPFPENLETAMEIEEKIFRTGAVPAALAILDGVIRVGLDEKSYNALAHNAAVEKFGNRDLGIAVARGLTGGMTVSACLRIAQQVGLSVFATGGIGGVHWDVNESMDISADLDEIARSRLAVICSGAKSVLDLGKTLEGLETRGIPVIGYRTGTFPAFYHSNSGFALDYQAYQPDELATIMKAHWSLDGAGGILITNPVPKDFEVSFSDLNAATMAALQEAKDREVSGKAVTPFLLRRLASLTEGATLVANRALLLENAELAGQLAVALND